MAKHVELHSLVCANGQLHLTSTIPFNSPLLLVISDPPIQDLGENCPTQRQQILNYFLSIF